MRSISTVIECWATERGRSHCVSVRPNDRCGTDRSRGPRHPKPSGVGPVDRGACRTSTAPRRDRGRSWLRTRAGAGPSGWIGTRLLILPTARGLQLSSRESGPLLERLHPCRHPGRNRLPRLATSSQCRLHRSRHSGQCRREARMRGRRDGLRARLEQLVPVLVVVGRQGSRRS